MKKEEMKGLTSYQARELLRNHGYNEIRDVGKKSLLQILFSQIKKNFILYLLAFAVVLSFLVGEPVTAYVICAVILFVVGAGFIQEYKAEKAIAALKELIHPVSIVIRDGKETDIPSRNLVPGDIVVLRTGEKVPADCRVLSEDELYMNESLLTGESKEIKKIVKEKGVSDENTVFAGSFVVRGRCRAKVMHTAMQTKFGKIAHLISTTEKEMPLQAKINNVTKYMSVIALSMAIITGIFVFLFGGGAQSLLAEAVILTIAIAVSAFPEGFPVVLTTTLALGASRMAKKDAIVNRMSIIETLGETTVICSDKTGTITRGEMTVKKLHFSGKEYEITGVGYDSEGSFLHHKKKVDLTKSEEGLLLLKAAALCNEARIEKEDDKYTVFGSPTEGALLVMAAKAGIFKDKLSCEQIDEIPFSSERKMMTVACKEKGKKTVYTKGALQYILEKCKYIRKSDKVVLLTKKEKEKILEENKELTSKALRTIGLAYKKFDKKKLEKDLVFLGFVGIEDPPRKGVLEAINTCRKAGISVKMITGDDKETAKSIAKQIHLDRGKILEGRQIDKLTDAQMKKFVLETVLFARVRPEHKIRIVRALKENGEIVTMTGDGVNDAPALKEAHIGIAMGKNGTDVSRSVADLTLKNDHFVTIVDAIREGRTIFNNIRKFVSYQLSCNYSELMVLFVGVLLSPVLGWTIPILLALHILFMNLVTDDLPAVTLGFNKSSDDIMTYRPHRNARILNRSFFFLLFASGTIMAILTLGAFFVTFNVLGQTVESARTTALVMLIVVEIAGAFNFRSFRKATLTRSPLVNPYLAGASLISIFATLAIIYTPLNMVFETVPIPLTDWLIALGFGVLFIALFDFFKRMNAKKKWLHFDE